MSRRKPQKSAHRTVTVHLDEEFVYQLDQYQTQFGIETRGAALVAFAKSGMSAIPLNTAVFEISQASVREVQKAERDALLAYLESRLALYRGFRS